MSDGQLKHFYSIIEGDVLAGLACLEPNSIHCVVTSPPYWGLRDYKIRPSIWDAEEGCEHQWGDVATRFHEKGGPGIQDTNEGSLRDGTKNSWFCTKCPAWRGQLGLEPTFQLYVKHIVQVFHEVKRVLKPTGTLFLNIGDTYAGGNNWKSAPPRPNDGPRANQARSEINDQYKTGLPQKCLVGIPERVMLGMIDDGWILRNKIPWVKPNHMPSSVKDRFSNGWESIFFFVKQPHYWFDLDAIRVPYEVVGITDMRPANVLRQKLYKRSQERYASLDDSHLSQYLTTEKKWDSIPGQQPQTIADHSGYFGPDGESLVNPAGKNPGDVWTITTQPFLEAHFATFPEAIPDRAIKCGCPTEICATCGKARERIMELGAIVAVGGSNTGKLSGKSDSEANSRLWNHQLKSREHLTTGWSVCSCPEPRTYRPGIVLDPFAGAGTVAKVAKDLERSSISIEINPEYIEMIKRRIDFDHETISGNISWLYMKAGEDKSAFPVIATPLN